MSLKTFLSNNKLSISVIAIIIGLTTFGVIQYNKVNSLKAELAASNQNILAVQDSLRITKDNAGKAEYDKLAFVAEVNDLKKLNADLTKEVKETKGKVAVITKADAVISDAGKAVASTTPILASNGDTVLKTEFSKDTLYSTGNYSKVAGTVEYNTANKGTIATISKNEIGFTLVTGIKNIKTKPEIFIRSDYPGLIVTSIQGAVLDPTLFQTQKPNKLSFGLQLGFSPLAYDLSSKSIQTHSQITIGVGLNYKLF